MKNNINCPSCGKSNSFYNLNCVECKNFLRNRVANIDLWDTISQILHSPSETIKNLVFAQKKNYLFLLLIFSGIANFTNSVPIKNILFNSTIEMDYYFGSLVFNTFLYSLFLIVASFFIWIVLKSFRYSVRIYDVIVINTFSFIPVIISFLFTTPVKLALFREYFLTFNPSPFIVKPLASYILYGIDLIFLIWSMVILFFGYSTILKNKAVTSFVVIFFWVSYFIALIL
ncbi:hypothetical protein APF79_07085 [bacterium BRH_c32]|nr:MAG: hypothetical protein APF79_07085 [bacterium BRH_c32]